MPQFFHKIAHPVFIAHVAVVFSLGSVNSVVPDTRAHDLRTHFSAFFISSM